MAYHVNKLERAFDFLIDILGRYHFGYHVRLEAALAALGWDPKVLEVLYLQMVHLVRGQETVRMSKRQGRYVTMAEFLDEVSVDAARYFFLMRSADTEIDFDLDLANLQRNPWQPPRPTPPQPPARRIRLADNEQQPTLFGGDL